MLLRIACVYFDVVFVHCLPDWPFFDSALLLLQLLSFRANLCCPATTVVEFFSCTREKNSVPLLPQEQNVSHQRNILFFCYHNRRMFLTREIFCSSASTIAECFSATTAECFSPDQNSSCAPTKIFCCSYTTVAEYFSRMLQYYDLR